MPPRKRKLPSLTVSVEGPAERRTPRASTRWWREAAAKGERPASGHLGAVCGPQTAPAQASAWAGATAAPFSWPKRKRALLPTPPPRDSNAQDVQAAAPAPPTPPVRPAAAAAAAAAVPWQSPPRCASGGVGGAAFGVDSYQGPRPRMEDRSVCRARVAPPARGRGPWYGFYGVFDGHGGAGAAEACAAQLCDHAMALLGEPGVDEPAALAGAFERVDQSLNTRATPTDNGHRLEGSTAVVLLLGDDALWVANAGDSRALLVFACGGSLQLSRDHKPAQPAERRRIEASGGTVTDDGRVEGILAMSRAIGCPYLAAHVTAAPDVRRFARRSRGQHSVVLASDGLWDVLTNAQVARVVAATDSPQRAAQRLVDAARAAGSTDNVTAVVVSLES